MANMLVIKESDDMESLHNLLKEALLKEQKLIEGSISRIKHELMDLEKKYGTTTDLFIQGYVKGETIDSPDFIDWSGLYHLYLKLLKKQSQLQNIQIVH